MSLFRAKVTDIEKENGRLSAQVDDYDQTLKATAAKALELEKKAVDAIADKMRADKRVEAAEQGGLKLQAENAALLDRVQWLVLQLGIHGYEVYDVPPVPAQPARLGVRKVRQ